MGAGGGFSGSGTFDLKFYGSCGGDIQFNSSITSVDSALPAGANTPLNLGVGAVAQYIYVSASNGANNISGGVGNGYGYGG